MNIKDLESKEYNLHSSYFLQLYEKSPDAIVILNSKNQVVHVNPSFTKLFKYSLKEIRSKDINNFIIPDDLKNEALDLTHSAFNKEIVRKDTIRKSKDGKNIWVSIIGLPIIMEDNSEGVFVIYNDISKSVEAKEKSEEASRMKSALLANMSHEFRTPMSAILGFSDILKEELTNEEHLSMIKDIHSSAKRLLNTLNSILELAHLESTDFSPNLSMVNVSIELASMSKSLKQLAEAKNLNFTLDIDDKNCICQIDIEIFRQIVSNIIDNALKYTHRGGVGIKVFKRTLRHEKVVSICVFDSGIGISRENQKLIFNEFRQVSEGISRNYEGTGLGLTLAKKMAEIMNGHIEVESEIGKGSVFTVNFPLPKIEDLSSLDKQISSGVISMSEKESSKHKTLLVEDNKTNKVLIRRFLQENFSVDDASSGKEALDMIRKEKYSLILMDINLGIGMNGLETAREIRKNREYASTPIIAVTGYALAGEKEKILENGFTDYISKPFTKEQLVEVLINSLGKS